jgi:diguanylate cyclase (GGDEF)-like protein/PAS domain S-box-containing protein
VILLAAVWLALPAAALKPIVIDPAAEHVDIGPPYGEAMEGRGDTLQVETAAQADGSTGRMSVQAVTRGTNPSWLVFALTNPTDKPLERWLIAERYTMVGAGIIWPDLDSRRIEAVTPSVGFIPERVKSDSADIFWLTVPPGQTVTFVAEMASERLPRVSLWKAVEYEQKSRDRHLFNGIVLGVTGLLAMFLTTVFAANHQVIFPAAALVTWSALALFCVDFGFWHKIFQMRAEDNAHYRAAAEAALAASLVIYLYTFLRLRHWHGFVRMLFAIWIAAQLVLVAAAVLDPKLVATVARLSFAVIGAVGVLLLLFLAARGQDRALNLMPTWILFLVWLFGASVAFSGRLTGEAIPFALVSGLALIIVLMGLTTTQFAFRSREPLSMMAPGSLQRRSLALEGSGAAVWEWIVRRDELKLDPMIESALGYNPGELSVKVDDFVALMHPADQERFKMLLASVKERSVGVMRLDFRMRHTDGSYRWLELEAATPASNDRRSLRCIGLVREVTDAKRSVERLMHDAVHDSLTGLANRELFLDRLGVAMTRAKAEANLRPTILFIDLDKFRNINKSFGLIVGDSLLLTLSRRLPRHIGPLDTLARVSGDQFAVLLLGEHEPRELAIVAERIRHAIRAPIRIAGQEIVLTGSIGIAIADGSQAAPEDLLREAEIAMHRAKGSGTDRIEIFQPAMRTQDERAILEGELRRAIEQRQITLLYHPIISLSTEELAGFEALVRWQHPKLGLLDPADFIPVAEESDLIVRLGSLVLGRAVADIARWQKELPRPEQPLFISVNISSRHLLHPDLMPEIRNLLGRNALPRGSLRLEIAEALVMENPEQATQLLEHLQSTGVELVLDGFGTGYSSLSYLQRLPFDTVKIDRAFVHQSSDAGTGQAMMRSLVALLHGLDRKIIAEGVETQEDAGALRSLGCEYAQGEFYNEPKAERDVLHLLKLIRKADRSMRRRGMARGRDKLKQKVQPSPDANAAALSLPDGMEPLGLPPPESIPPDSVGHAPSMGPGGRRPPPPPPSEPASFMPPPTGPAPTAPRPSAPAQSILPPIPPPGSTAPPTRPVPPTIDGRPVMQVPPGGVPPTGHPPANMFPPSATPPTGRPGSPTMAPPPPPPPRRTDPPTRPVMPPPVASRPPALTVPPPPPPMAPSSPVLSVPPPPPSSPPDVSLGEVAQNISQLANDLRADGQTTTPPTQPVPPRRQMVLLPSTAASLARLASGQADRKRDGNGEADTQPRKKPSTG